LLRQSSRVDNLGDWPWECGSVVCGSVHWVSMAPTLSMLLNVKYIRVFQSWLFTHQLVPQLCPNSDPNLRCHNFPKRKYGLNWGQSWGSLEIGC
jgi:hypothetical protein